MDRGISLLYAWFICLLAAFFYSYDFLLRVTPSIIGYFLERAWSGGHTAVGTPQYAIADYRQAFTVLLALLAISFILTFFIPGKEKR